MASCIMKQLREKHVSTEISRCSWSPKMDLLAITNVQGQVSLHRLSWQQVWLLNPPGENIKVTAITWRPDSKVIAIGYSSGKLHLVNIEDGSLVHHLEFEDAISALSWNKYTDNNNGKDDTYKDWHNCWSSFIYSLPPLSKTFGECGAGAGEAPSDVWQDPKLLQDQSELNILSVGTEHARLHMYAFGLFDLGSVDVLAGESARILNVIPSTNLETFSVVVEKGEEEKVIGRVMLNCSVISLRHKELHSLAQKYGQIYSLMTYTKHTLVLMEEAWESTLIEMDAKLASYAMTVPEGSVSADFLELLVFGHTSAEFELFLTNKLTEKWLKKLRHSVDLCYSTMQRLVVRYLQQVGVTLIFLLSQLEGMSKQKDLFSSLGVHENEVSTAMGQAGSFLIKATEMLYAIETSTRDFHTFLRWVSGVHLRLLHEQAPPDLCRMSQQEMSNLLNFLNDSFEETETVADGERRTHFRLERAGQYLKNENLKIAPAYQDSPFTRLVDAHPCLASHRLIFEHHRETSLIQEHLKLFDALTDMGSKPSSVISASVGVGEFLCIGKEEPNSQASIAQINLGSEAIVTAVILSVRQSQLHFIEWPLGKDNEGPARACKFTFVGEGKTTSMSILDVHFYSPETLSILLQDPSESRSSNFAQLSVEIARKELFPWVPQEESDMEQSITANSIPDLVSLRRLEIGPACMMSVSGPRKVAALIGENRRRIRIYEMEAEDDEEDEDDEDDETRNEGSIVAASLEVEDEENML